MFILGVRLVEFIINICYVILLVKWKFKNEMKWKEPHKVVLLIKMAKTLY